MGIRKDKEKKYWVYQFQYQGKNYGGRGFQSRRDTEAARAKRREEVKRSHVIATTTATAFKTIANEWEKHGPCPDRSTMGKFGRPFLSEKKAGFTSQGYLIENVLLG